MLLTIRNGVSISDFLLVVLPHLHIVHHLHLHTPFACMLWERQCVAWKDSQRHHHQHQEEQQHRNESIIIVFIWPGAAAPAASMMMMLLLWHVLSGCRRCSSSSSLVFAIFIIIVVDCQPNLELCQPMQWNVLLSLTPSPTILSFYLFSRPYRDLIIGLSTLMSSRPCPLPLPCL